MLQRQPQVGGVLSGRGKEKNPINLLLIILEFLLPCCDQHLSLKDRQLVEWCKERLGNVRVNLQYIQLQVAMTTCTYLFIIHLVVLDRSICGHLI